MHTFSRLVRYGWLATLATCLLAMISPEKSIAQQALTVAYSVLLGVSVVASLLYLVAWLWAALTGKLDKDRVDLDTTQNTVADVDSSTLRSARLSWQIPLGMLPILVVVNAILRDSQSTGGYIFIVGIGAGLIAAVSSLCRSRSRSNLGHAIAGLIINVFFGATVIYGIATVKG